jgi:hypothetical protein
LGWRNVDIQTVLNNVGNLNINVYVEKILIEMRIDNKPNSFSR